MGRGDKKSKKGKIWKGSYGNSRRRKSAVKFTASAAKPAAEAAPEAKPKAKRTTKKKSEVAE